MNQLLTAGLDDTDMSSVESLSFLQELSSGSDEVSTLRTLPFSVGADATRQDGVPARLLQDVGWIPYIGDLQSGQTIAAAPDKNADAPLEIGGGVRMRQLMARSSRKVAGGGNVQSAVPTVYVASQNWTVADLQVNSMRIAGTVLRSRASSMLVASLLSCVHVQTE